MAFLAAIAWFCFRLYNEQEMTLMTMPDGRRALLFGSVGAIALLIVGYEEFRAWGGGILVWIVLMAGVIAAIFLVWRERRLLAASARHRSRASACASRATGAPSPPSFAADDD